MLTVHEAGFTPPALARDIPVRWLRPYVIVYDESTYQVSI